jgi:hypothetical protein
LSIREVPENRDADVSENSKRSSKVGALSDLLSLKKSKSGILVEKIAQDVVYLLETAMVIRTT